MGTFVAMLRSVNVSGRNRLPWPICATLVGSLGFGDVATYVQSGNVVLTGSGRAPAVARAIEERIAADLGLDGAGDGAEQAAAAPRCSAANPYVRRDADPKTLHVTFLADRPDPAAVDALEGRGRDGSARTGSRSSAARSYLHCPAATARPS